MEYQTLFWALIAVAVLQMIGLYMVGQSIKTLLSSKKFKERLVKKESSNKETAKKIMGIMILLFLTTFSNYSLAESAAEVAETVEEVVVNDSIYNRTNINILLAINVLMAGILLYMRSLFKSFYRIGASEQLLASKKRKRRVKINRILTDSVPMSEEETILLNHDYDGITELDNNLPPWWKWDFISQLLLGFSTL